MIILQGIVGSTAYGLARNGSDVDRLGVFAAPTLEVAGLNWHSAKESVVRHEPSDFTLHEAGKFCKLALKCNPTVTELLWLNDSLYEHVSPIGGELVEIRTAFLSSRLVRDAYGEYAYAQVKRLQDRGDGSFSSEMRGRTVKHARHLLRLLRQGRELLETGALTVVVDNPQEYFDFDDMSVEQMTAVYDREQRLFTEARSVLPENPDRARVVDWLECVRTAYMMIGYLD